MGTKPNSLKKASPKWRKQEKSSKSDKGQRLKRINEHLICI